MCHFVMCCSCTQFSRSQDPDPLTNALSEEWADQGHVPRILFCSTQLLVRGNRIMIRYERGILERVICSQTHGCIKDIITCARECIQNNVSCRVCWQMMFLFTFYTVPTVFGLIVHIWLGVTTSMSWGKY